MKEKKNDPHNLRFRLTTGLRAPCHNWPQQKPYRLHILILIFASRHNVLSCPRPLECMVATEHSRRSSGYSNDKPKLCAGSRCTLRADRLLQQPVINRPRLTKPVLPIERIRTRSHVMNIY